MTDNPILLNVMEHLRFNSITELHLNRLPVFHLETCDLQAIFEALAHNTSVKTLTIWFPQDSLEILDLSATCLQHVVVTSAPNVTYLEEFLAKLPLTVQSLELGSSSCVHSTPGRLTGSVAERLSRLSLRSLALRDCCIQTPLQLDSLQFLELDHVESDQFVSCANVTTLHHIASHVPSLSMPPSIRTLRCINSSVEALQELLTRNDCPALSKLDLRGTTDAYKVLDQLSHCATLQSLNLEETGLCDPQLQLLQLSPNLRKLNLRGNHLDGVGLEALGNVAYLDLSDNPLTQMLTKLPNNVRCLVLQDTHIAWDHHLTVPASLHTLSLARSSCRENMERLLPRLLQQLRELDLRAFRGMSDELVDILIGQLTRPECPLQALYLSQYSGLTDVARHKFAQALPQMTNLRRLSMAIGSDHEWIAGMQHNYSIEYLMAPLSPQLWHLVQLNRAGRRLLQSRGSVNWPKALYRADQAYGTNGIFHLLHQMPSLIT